ncbi:MAG: hypothetical protein Greene041662_106 [Candidatus Peregrinibacteria bacterium Greene0416_62]|nr:MAG: hypothetical protein Greene041662_106 [Candidatus Peregrinibacteria bacterium Greene0416_62]TSC99257.1 MAG: hypothetical protein Greene101449_669 [Candidatus Peregrinibacteria bacterium Greene1014_49]
MRIAIAITDSKGKNLVFGTDTRKAYSRDEIIDLVKADTLRGFHVVKTGKGSYLRSNPNAADNDNLDALSLSSYKLFLSLDDVKYLMSEEGMEAYIKYLSLHRRSIEERGEHVITIDGFPLITQEQVIEKLRPLTNILFEAASEDRIDPNTLGAIMVDEVARANPWESIIDRLLAAHIGTNASVGIAQVKMIVIRELIEKGFYKPNPDDEKLSKANIAKTSNAYLYAYAVLPRHSIRFASARIRQTVDFWAPTKDISDHPEIIGTLYHQGLGKPKANPKPNPRGLQIAQEFYPLAQHILQS